MTPEQRRAELEAAGFDMKEVHAKADAFAEELKKTAPETPEATTEQTPAPRAATPRATAKPRRRPMAAIVAAGVTVAAAGGAVVAYVGGGGVGSPAPDAQEVRREGLDACRDRSWQRCLEKLDRARELDPDGDRAPDVQKARRAARRPWVQRLRPSRSRRPFVIASGDPHCPVCDRGAAPLLEWKSGGGAANLVADPDGHQTTDVSGVVVAAHVSLGAGAVATRRRSSASRPILPSRSGARAAGRLTPNTLSTNVLLRR